jgi:hypothetical protein
MGEIPASHVYDNVCEPVAPARGTVPRATYAKRSPSRFFSLAQPFSAGGPGRFISARFIGLPLSRELKQAWKPDESGLQLDMSDTQP